MPWRADVECRPAVAAPPSLDGASKANWVTAVPLRSVELPGERLNDRDNARARGQGEG